jgi:hypothetical protein
MYDEHLIEKTLNLFLDSSLNDEDVVDREDCEASSLIDDDDDDDDINMKSIGILQSVSISIFRCSIQPLIIVLNSAETLGYGAHWHTKDFFRAQSALIAGLFTRTHKVTTLE